jgi:hypothetical protein
MVINPITKNKDFILCLALIPNSKTRTIFKKREIKPVEVEAFKLRLVYKQITFSLVNVIYPSIFLI